MKKIKEIKFIAKSAQEAADRVRDELGPGGRVISVRQHTGTGMGRFLSAPKLEVVAVLEAPDEVQQPAPAVQPSEFANGAQTGPDTLVPPAAPAETGKRGRASKAEPARTELTCAKFLSRLGLKANLLARIESTPEGRQALACPVTSGLPQVVAWLRDQRNAQPLAKNWRRMAFLGGAGAGKTTALCKFLANEVLINNRKPLVLQTAVDRPHLDGALEMYCEILGLQYSKYAGDLDIDQSVVLCVDFPGFSISNDHEIPKFAAALDDLNIDTRVLVLNAACEDSTLGLFIQKAADLNINAQILTHLDEVVDFGKLWSFYLDKERPLLFAANGPNVLGDTINDVFGFLLEKTFPR